uniref:Uncharacterized protein n=1 Tax=Panagrellus redivivus TaxID=6233 RepID=A0A7E4VAP3_PANRE
MIPDALPNPRARCPSVLYMLSLPSFVVKNNINNYCQHRRPSHFSHRQARQILRHPDAHHIRRSHHGSSTIHNIIRFSRLITKDSIGAVFNTERVKVRDLLNICAFDLAFCCRTPTTAASETPARTDAAKPTATSVFLF